MATPQINYDVALSFAEEDRPVVEEFAGELRRRGIRVFYDKFVEAELWGNDLYDYLSEVYSNRCKYCVVFVSQAYARKDWTRLERRSAQSRSLREQREFLLPVRLDDTELDGLLPTVKCVDLRNQSVSAVADLLCHKLDCHTASEVLPSDPGHVVIELCSNFEYSFDNKREMIDIQDSVLGMAGVSEVRLVGFEDSPHRLQIQATPAAYSRLRTEFLAGELNRATGVKWTKITALEGKERAPAPTQVPLAPLRPVPTENRARQIVCHLDYIMGFEREADQAVSCLGRETVTDMRALRAFITATGDRVYVHSNFRKAAFHSPTKIATNLPVDLFTFFVNLVFLDLPNDAGLAEAKIAHTKHAEYFVKLNKVRKRGDEFYAGAMNIRFV